MLRKRLIVKKLEQYGDNIESEDYFMTIVRNGLHRKTFEHYIILTTHILQPWQWDLPRLGVLKRLSNHKQAKLRHKKVIRLIEDCIEDGYIEVVQDNHLKVTSEGRQILSWPYLFTVFLKKYSKLGTFTIGAVTTLLTMKWWRIVWETLINFFSHILKYF